MPQPHAVDFANIAMRLHEQEDVDATLDTIVRLACETVDADMCGVMRVHRGNRVESAAVTHDAVRTADAVQMEVGQGPCLESMVSKAVFVIDDTAVDDRWEPWCRRVVDLGIRSVLSVRLFTPRGTIGSLNVYSSEIGHFTSDDAQIGSIYAGHASVALAAARTEAGLREAMESRHLIGLAQGRLIEKFGLDQEQSFSVLRRYSQDRNTKLRVVAQHVLETGELPA